MLFGFNLFLLCVSNNDNLQYLFDLENFYNNKREYLNKILNKSNYDYPKKIHP